MEAELLVPTKGLLAMEDPGRQLEEKPQRVQEAYDLSLTNLLEFREMKDDFCDKLEANSKMDTNASMKHPIAAIAV